MTFPNVRQRVLGDIASIVMGQSPKGATCNFSGVGVPLLNGPTEFGYRHPHPVQYTTEPKKFAEPGDLLFCVRGSTTGRMNWADRRYAIGRGVASIRGKDGYPTSYVRAVIEHRLGSLLRSATGSTFPNVTRDMLLQLPVPDHDVTTAVRIAAVLDVLEGAAWNLVQMNSTLEGIAQAIFQSWFIDFDPVHAKAAGREPEGIDAETAALFPSEFVDSELGPIPKGWKCRALGEAFEINPVRRLKKGTLAPYLDMASTPTQGHRPEAIVMREVASGVKFMNGDTLLARITPCLENGKTAFVDFLSEGQVGWGSTEFVVLRPRPPLPLFFGYLLARDPTFRAYAAMTMTGSSGRQRIDISALAEYKVIIPDVHVAKAFEHLVEPLRSRIVLGSEKARTLADLRNALLPQLISGKLRLSEVEDIVKEAAS